ncbi:hypothetical protein JB92DRAFT_3114564 [Gautieria morchelliformis]|nr:hypothetical protein JB92DRAFT_3114564 [Gautieria morchelliformis]
MLFHLEVTPVVCPTISHASWGPPLLVSTPSRACQPSPPRQRWRNGAAPPILHDDDPEPLFSSTPSPPPATTLHERDPFLLTLMTLAKALYMHACVTPARVLPHVRGGGTLYMGKAERMIELVRNELHMAAVLGRGA